MVWLLVLAIVLIIVGMVLWLKSGVKDIVAASMVVGGFSMVIGLLSGLIFVDKGEKKPKAIDIYRDKTTLEITYKIRDNDTLEVDTTVVWKPEFDPNTKENEK